MGLFLVSFWSRGFFWGFVLSLDVGEFFFVGGGVLIYVLICTSLSLEIQVPPPPPPWAEIQLQLDVRSGMEPKTSGFQDLNSVQSEILPSPG